jgi:hypothetical protein
MAATVLGRTSGRSGGVLAAPAVPACLALFMLPGLHPLLMWPVGLAALLIVGMSLTAYAAVPRVTALLAGAVLALGFSLYHFFGVNSQPFANIFSPELWLAGKLHNDTAFHVAVSAMISQFGIPSTGLDGLVRINYHSLSHAWLGLLAKSVGLQALSGYFIGMQVVALPLLFFVLANATMAFVQSNASVARPLLLILANMSLVLLAHTWGWDSHLVSESYILGLILVLSGLPFLKKLAENTDRRLQIQHLLIGLVIGTLAFSAKVSVGFIWLAGFGYVLIRFHQIRIAHVVILGVWAVAFAGLALTVVLPRDHVDTTTFWPLHFFRYGDVASSNLIVISIATIVLLTQLRKASRPKQHWIELVLVLLAASTAPALLFQFDAGAAYYFLNVGTWIGIAVLSATAIDLATRARLGLAIRAAALLTVAVLAAHAATILPSRFVALRTSYHAQLDPQGYAAFETEGPFSQAALGAMASAYSKSMGPHMLAELQRTDAAGRHDTLIFIPPEAAWFWSSSPICTVAPLTVPGATGLPMLMGVPPTSSGCELGEYYGYSAYGPQSRSVDTSDVLLCGGARDRGFSNVVVFDEFAKARMLECDHATQAVARQ